MTLPYDECRLILVPEDSVIPETRTLIIFNRRKEFVGVFESLNFLIVCRIIYLKQFNKMVKKIKWFEDRI